MSGDLRFDGLIVDLDGVVWLSGEPIAGAVEAIRALRASGIRVLFLTNDPQSSRAEQAARLVGIGIPATAGDVMTSGAVAARFLAGQTALAGKGVLALGSHALHDDLIAATGAILAAVETATGVVATVIGKPEPLAPWTAP